MDIDLTQYATFLFALIFVIGLIALMAVVLRKFSPSARLAARVKGSRRRLAVVEAASIDSRRTLVLVRRDETEHLILLGHTQDVVVENNISPPPEIEAHTNDTTMQRGSADWGRAGWIGALFSGRAGTGTKNSRGFQDSSTGQDAQIQANTPGGNLAQGRQDTISNRISQGSVLGRK